MRQIYFDILVMTKRKGGIGRRPGRKKECNQKTVSKTSASSVSKLLVKRQKEDMIKMESRRERRIVTSITKDMEEHNVQEHLKIINDLEKYNTTMIQDLNKIKVNSKRKKARYEANTKRLKSSLVMKDKIIIEKNREIQLSKNTAEQMLIQHKEHSEKKYQEERILEKEDKQKQLLHAKECYEKRLQYRTLANKILNDKLKRSRTNAAQQSEELKQVKDTYSDIRKVRLEARKIKANAAIITEKEKHLREMTEVVSKRQRELKQAALKKTRDAIRQKNKLDSLATNRLKKIQILQDKNTKLMDTQHNNQTYVTKDFKKVRKGRSDNKAGGAHVWPIWMLQLVLEMLVNGTPPSAIPLNIKSQAALTTPGVIIEDFPGLGYVRNCRTILRVIGETLTAYRLGKQAEWQQLFTDGTSRRQIDLQT